MQKPHQKAVKRDVTRCPVNRLLNRTKIHINLEIPVHGKQTAWKK
jgi:uncharacterized OsmC-like protein